MNKQNNFGLKRMVISILIEVKRRKYISIFTQTTKEHTQSTLDSVIRPCDAASADGQACSVTVLAAEPVALHLAGVHGEGSPVLQAGRLAEGAPACPLEPPLQIPRQPAHKVFARVGAQQGAAAEFTERRALLVAVETIEHRLRAFGVGRHQAEEENFQRIQAVAVVAGISAHVVRRFGQARPAQKDQRRHMLTQQLAEARSQRQLQEQVTQRPAHVWLQVLHAETRQKRYDARCRKVAVQAAGEREGQVEEDVCTFREDLRRLRVPPHHLQGKVDWLDVAAELNVEQVAHRPHAALNKPHVAGVPAHNADEQVQEAVTRGREKVKKVVWEGRCEDEGAAKKD
eukprot:m.186004 g.186004  ORF g.186004 m.186004 type:complete len:343 (+) comp17505_c0_seq7:2071-3099(+)